MECKMEILWEAIHPLMEVVVVPGLFQDLQVAQWEDIPLLEAVVEVVPDHLPEDRVAAEVQVVGAN